MNTLVPTQAVVTTRQGRVSGTVANGVSVFKGIPYAAPPFGKNRFLPPQPIPAWDGVRDALAFGPKSPQPEYPPEVRLLLPESVGSDEDCLNLNVWAPEKGSGLPVMVWIAGGMYEFHGTGGSPWYDGSAFARDGVVCVTIGYRVGPDGFLYFGDGEANLGLLDQIAALVWVRENIEAFGGDPQNVCLFGESAGALSIGTLLAMPAAKGLFRRAILQSGASHWVLSVDDARRIGEDLASRLAVPPTREAIAEVPMERLLAATVELRDDLAAHPDPAHWGQDVVNTMLPWQPVVDGRALPERPIDAVAGGASSDVDLLIGTNTDENRLFLMGMIDQIPEPALAALAAGYGLPECAIDVYRASRPRAAPGDLMAAIQTDWCWRIPAIRLAEARRGAPGATFMYEFCWRSPQFGGALGACHALEIGFVFDTLGASTEGLAGPNPPQELADRMHAAWVAFASDGAPGWPQYKLPERATMRFDAASEVMYDPRAEERRVWEGVR